MECNRDEAVRSRCFAEQKFLQHDVFGARQFALKAQCLFPDLEGLPQLLAVLDVHIVAQQKIDGVDVNWYGILQTDASADDVTIRKQYRKLALILHPDKNKAIGAEAAFKLISEAWRVLSDKEKKAAHDAQRNSNGFGLSAMNPAKRFCNFSQFNYPFQPRQASSLKKNFWTGCPSCKMHFEFMRAHENKQISCRACGKVFQAAELQGAEPSARVQPPEWSPQTGRSSCPEKHSEKDGGSSHNMGSSFNIHWGPHKFNAAKYANSAAQMVQQTYEAVRRERVKAQKEARERAATARMKADMEALKRERKERKQRRKEQQEKAAKASTQPQEHNVTLKSRFQQVAELGRADNKSSLPTEEVAEGDVGMSSLNGSIVGKETGPYIKEKSARADQMQEPFWCRARNGFDSASSYDSNDCFGFAKRLKVDV